MRIIANSASVLLDVYNLGLGGREMTWSSRRPSVEVTAWDDTVVKQVQALPMVEVSYSGLWDDTSEANEAGLRTLIESTASKTLSLFLGDTVGDPAVTAQVLTVDYATAPRLGDAVPIAGEFRNGSPGPEFVRALNVGRQATDSLNLGSLDGADDGFSSGSTGGAWGYHVTQISGTWNIRWMANSSDATSGQVEIDADSSVSAVQSARAETTKSIQRFSRLRVELTTTSGSITIYAWQRRF